MFWILAFYNIFSLYEEVLILPALRIYLRLNPNILQLFFKSCQLLMMQVHNLTNTEENKIQVLLFHFVCEQQKTDSEIRYFFVLWYIKKVYLKVPILTMID